MIRLLWMVLNKEVIKKLWFIIKFHIQKIEDNFLNALNRAEISPFYSNWLLGIHVKSILSSSKYFYWLTKR